MSSNPGRVADGPAEKAPLVLLVDDLEVNIVLLEAKLEIEGCATIHALSGSSALTLAEEQSPDLIVLDVMMPKMTVSRCAVGLRPIHERPIYP